ncbi:transcription factor E2FA-like [Hibiscus syriacus]|uniref:Transcription factor E2FA-like n=1 Tax=Hibiscus syriacus TaxID=106335 RepID=A0A6A3CKM1_HIBSY|nr:transcription factor E2FA-like [Hibiscus syriacus]
MLSASTSLLRTACIQSHAHPLQCRALELCFNVGLNRLPASSSGPMLGTHSQYPSISNALVAAFKRAQAHQRRGSIENQQQPLLAVKIELEQLIISILDDPSVSRVMREAGFTSTQVKSNVEQAVSLEICSQNAPSVNNNKSKETDKAEIKFVNLSFSSFGYLNRVEVEQTLEELKKHIGNCLGKGIVLNLGDLKWAIEYRASSSEQSRGYYCPVEHMIMEIGKLLVSNIGERGRFTLMGSSTFQTYMRCKSGHPSLETVWGLLPLTIPAGSLRFSLITDSELQSRATSKKVENGSSWWTSAEPQHHDWPVVEPIQTVEPTSALRLYIPEHNYKDLGPHLSSSPNSACSTDVMEMEYVHKFKELNAENLTTLCTALENKVPWQKDIVPEIVTTILKCRSGTIGRKGKLIDAVSCNPHRVFFIEDVEQSDYFSQMGFRRTIQKGRISRANGEEAVLSDAIVILSCESFSSRSRACSPPAKLKSDCISQEEKVGASEETTSPCVSLDLNMSIDDDSLEEQSIQDIGLLEYVDRRIVFKIQEL